ncbi:hypothetical protein, variant 2 [Aphanomyces astaci]|uniref:Fibronectin type-III domain-containing protein n=1 Tax=Aphanomyces astaci TaxID=112090 RepID=W4GS85_APHAT|nr:hypothetical protein, variant 2 [Aphanomyces astaci]ETV81763.1 hypothetical protein, variant 2 [Aphanomyces astaci]|eukprot:XP_009828500.1 hypothetical protein, variant 2 [Aphanomyces astaci]
MSMNKLQMQLKKKEKERKAAAKKGSATSTESKAKAAADAQAFQCKICLTPFPRTSKGPQMIAHAESKHPRVSPEECFPQLQNAGWTWSSVMPRRGIHFLRGVARQLQPRRHLHHVLGLVLLVGAVSRTNGVVTTLYFASFLIGMVLSFTRRRMWLGVVVMSLGGIMGQCVVAGWPAYKSTAWCRVTGLHFTPYNIVVDAAVLVTSTVLLWTDRQFPLLHARPTLQREVSGVRALAFVFKRCPVLHVWVMKLKFHESIHGLFAFFAEVLIGICLFTAALSSRRAFGAVYYVLFVGRLAVWSFWTPRLLPSQGITQMPTPGHPRAPSPPLLKRTASNQDHPDKLVMAVPTESLAGNMSTEVDAVILTTYRTGGEQTITMPPPHPLINKPIVQGLLLYTFSVLVLCHVFQYAIMREVAVVQTIGEYAGMFALPGTVATNWLGYVFLVAVSNLYICLAKMLSFYASYDDLPQTTPARRQAQVPVIMRVLRNELVATSIAMFWAISYPSYASLGLFALAMLALVTHGLHDSVQFKSASTIQPLLLSITTVYGVCTGLVQYALMLPALHPFVSTNQFALLGYTELDLAIQNAALVGLCLCQRARWRYPRPASFVPTMGASTEVSPPSLFRQSFPPPALFGHATWHAYHAHMQAWCQDAKSVWIGHVDSMVLFTIYVVVLSTSVNLFQTGSLVLASYLSLFHHHRRRLWRVLLVYTLAVCLTLYTWNISCPPSTPLLELVGLTCYRNNNANPAQLATSALDNNTSSGATPGTPSVSIPALTTLWSSPLFNAQLVLIAQVVLQLVLYSRTWHHVPPTTNVVSTETTRDTLPWYFLSTLVGEIDRVFRSGGVIVCYIVLLLLAFNWEIRRGHVTVVGFIQLALFCALVDSHMSNIVQFPRGTAHYGKLWRLVLIVQVVVVVLRYLYQFDPVSQAILTHWLPTFCTMDDIGFDSLSSKTHLSNLFAYLFPTIVMAGLAAWQLASMSAVPEMRWEFPSSFKFQREWRHLCHALSFSSSLLVGLAVILATDSINLMGFLYYMSAVYAVLKRQYMVAWPYLFTTSSFVLLSTYVLQLNLPWFNTPEATQTGQWLGMARLDDTMSLWTVNRVPLVMIGLCALQRLGSVLLPPPTAAADTDEADKPPPWWEFYTNHVAPVFTRDTHVTILMLSLLVSSFVHLNVVSMAYMVAVRGIMLADWDDPTVHHRCIRRLTILLVGVSVAQYLVQLWFPPWLVAPQPTLPPWTWLDPPYQAWLMLHFQNKWSLLADFMALFSVYLIAPPPPVAAPSGPLSSDNPCIMPSKVPAAGPALATTTTTILPPPPPPYQVFVANYSIVVVLVWVFITGCAQFGVASGLYLGWSIYMLFHLDRLDWQPVLLGSLQSYNWFYLLLLVVYQCPWFNDITQTCTLGTNQPLGDGICLSLPVALGLYKAPRNIDSSSPSSSSSGPASSTKLSIAIFVMIAIQMQVFASAPYRLVLENHRKEQDRCQKRGYAMNDELARHRIQQWRYLKLEKQAAIQRLKAIVSKLVNKVEEMMDIAMGLHYSLPPMAPHRPTVLSRSQNSITLAWTAPDSKMHKIRGYRISRQTFPSVTLLGDFGDTVTVRANQRTAEITGLRPGTSYQFKVAAVSRMGEGPFSVASEPAATIELDWGESCTAGWIKAHRTTSDHKKTLANYIELYLPWLVPARYAQRYVVVDDSSITFYKTEVLALKHRRRDAISTRSKPRHPPPPPAAASLKGVRRQHWQTYLLAQVTSLDLSETQIQLDDMSPLLYCIEVTVSSTTSAATSKYPCSVSFSLQPDEAGHFDKWLVALMYVVPPQALGARILAYRQAQNLEFPERIMRTILAPLTAVNDSTTTSNTTSNHPVDKTSRANVVGKASLSTALSKMIDQPTRNAIYAQVYRVVWALQDSALQGESVACTDDIEADVLPPWSAFRVVVTQAFRSHSAKLCYLAFVISFSRQGDVLNLVYVMVLFAILLCENPRPHAALWKWVLKYSFFVVLVRYMFQLPFFCHQYTHSHVLYPSFQPFCPSSAWHAATSSKVQPIVLLGLYKFDGSATAAVGSTFQGLQWNFLVICSILFHRRELQMRGFWVYPGNEALKWTQTALWRRLFRSRRSFNLDTNSTRSLEDLPQRDPLALPDSHQMDDIERADRLARMDSKDSLDERDFELADYLAKSHEPTLSNHQPSHSSTDLSTHVARLLEKDELPPLKLNPLAPSFDYDSSSDSSDDDEKARPSSPQHRADKIYKPPGHRTTDHLPMPQGSNQPQRQLVKKNRFQWWLSHHMPPWMLRYYDALLPQPPLHWDKDIKCAVTGSKPGRDFLLVAFGLQVGIMAYIVLFFHQFGSPVETSALFSLSSSFQTSLLSGYMVGLVFFQVVVVLWDRVAYVYTSLLSKLLSHYFLVVGVHIQLWLVLPLHTGVYLHASPFLVGLYLLQCCAMGVSAAQLKHGYVVFRGNPFSLRHATSAFKTLFSVYMAIPFAFEVRTLLDYLCSTTALDMQLWLVLEGIGAHLFLVKMQMEGRVQDGYILQGNMRQPVLAKFKSAGVYFMALVVCLLAPMIMFSTANPTTINNPVLHATMTFGLLQPDGTFQQLYNSEENESPLTTKVVVANVETLVQQVSFMEYSNDMWSSSPPLRRRLMTRLNSTEGIQWRMTITLKRAAPDGQQIVAYDMVTSITPAQRTKLMRMMDVSLTDESTANSMSSGILTIPDMYPPVLNVPAATPPTARGPYLPRAIQIQRSTEASGSFWTLSSADAWAYGNPSTDSIDNATMVQCQVRGFCFFVVSDNIVAGLTTLGIGTYGITATYVFVIFTIGGYVKNALRGSVTDVLYNELPNPDDLMDLVEGIYIARTEVYIGHLKDEARLFETLIRVLRSPETLLKVTGPNIIHIPSKEKLD